MAVYNVDKIDNWYNDFVSLKNKFNNTYYGDYKSSYIKSCTDSAVKRMCLSLDKHYSKIQKMYNNINTTWNSYLEDLKNTDIRLAGGKGGVNASSVSSKLAKLPTLKEYKRSLNIRIKSVSGVVGTAKGIGWSEDKNFADNLSNSMEILLSSAAVIATSVRSGVAGLFEDLVDGVLWAGTAAVTGTATLFGKEEWANNAQNTMMDVISYDVVGNVNKALYEKTSLGRKINEKSILKYDSEVAQNIQSISTKATEIAAATVLTVATGGAAAPVTALVVGGTGFFAGAGAKAQEDFSKENRKFSESSKEIAISGGIKAIEFYSEGQMGAGAINAVGAIKSAGGVKNLFSGIKTALVNGESNLFTKDALKNGIKATFKDVDTYMDSLGAAFDNITYDNENGIQVDWKGLTKETACNFTMNFVFGFVGNAFEARMTSGMKNMELDLNTNNMKNTMESINSKNVEVSSLKTEANLDSLKKEYNQLLNQSKEPWFVKAKEAGDNGWAWDLNKVSEADNIVKRMQELESTLGIKNTGVPEFKIYDYSQAKKEADAMVQKIKNKPIPGFENIDINSQEYKKAMQEIYSKPSPSGKQDLSQVENPFNKNNVKKVADLNTTLELNPNEINKAANGTSRIDKSSRDLNLNKIYSDNPEILLKQGMSYEQYATKNGIKIKDYSNDMDLAIDIGDENWYLVQVLKNNEKNMSPDQLQAVASAIKKPRSELDTNELINVAGPFLKEKDKINLNEIRKHPNMSNLSLQNKNTLHQFQKAGGCEINGTLRGKDYSWVGINSLYDLEMEMNNLTGGCYNGANVGHPRTIDKNYSVVEEINDIIKNNANTSTIKGVSYLDSVGPNVPTGQVLDIIDQFGSTSPEALQAVQDLIGLDITDHAFNSKTIPSTKKTRYGDRFYKTLRGDKISLDIKVESYISPGCGAYIDTYGGIEGGLGEMLIKKDCSQKIIDAYVDINTNKLVLVTLYT